MSSISDDTETLESPEGFEAEIRDFARALPTMDYYRVLDVPRGADPDEIREGFFERSKRFHPDRHFRKLPEPYLDLLNEIYKRVVAAHDVLRDKKLRRGYDEALEPKTSKVPRPEAMAKAPADPDPQPKGEPGESPSKTPLRDRGQAFKSRGPLIGRARPAPRSRRDSSLRQRKGLRSPDVLLRGLKAEIERGRSKAKRHFEESQEFKVAADWPRCVAALKLAMAFDPREKRFHDELAEVLPSANAERATEIRKKGELFLQSGDKQAAVECLEEACDLLPTDAGLAHQVASILFDLHKNLKKAAIFAEHAVSLDPKTVLYLKTLGMIYKADGNPVKAQKNLQRAWAIDPLDEEVKAELGTL
ncbi:MAG: DnaJ domain-containing protein [bacterium]|nr:DnaJ domain-containing protein [bacterium]